MTSALTKPEKSALAECEETIERGMGSFVEVGNALLRIRHERLYRAEFGTFQEYCEARWQMSDRHARRMIEAAEVVENLSESGPTGPVSERQTRPLAALPPVQQREAWDKATETAKTPGKPTAREVEAAVEVVAPKKRESISYVPSNGLQYAQMAIDSLEKIQPNDTQRTRAFGKVTNWIAKQEAKQ